MLQYYQRPFLYFLKEIQESLQSDTIHHRKSFWNLIPNGDYRGTKAEELIEQYQKSLEERVKSLVEKYSIPYWLHLSRRVFPYTRGTDKRPETIYLNRLNVDIAIQKYASKTLCGHIGPSKEIDISEIFNGLLMSEEFEVERRLIELSPNMYVLTDFTQQNLLEYYKLEELCYELWVCGAKSRAIAKGAFLYVDNNEDELFNEVRTEELGDLIQSYDQRTGGFISSATGTVYSDSSFDKSSSFFIPLLNVFDIDIKYLNEGLSRVFNVKIQEDSQPNFLIFPLPLKKYINSHTPFDKDFYEKNGVRYQTIIYFIASLCTRYFKISLEEKQGYIIHIMQRGYEGPEKKQGILDTVKSYLPYVEEIMDKEIALKDDEIENAFNHLTLKNQENLKFLYPGTTKMLLPADNKRYYIDYSKIPVILDNLFYGIDLNKHSFRGDTLETAVENTESFLPTYPLKGEDGSEKQIDYSIKLGDILIIVECKVVAMASSIYAGSRQSVDYRTKQVVERGLKEVDEKANWLKKRPVGKNYNINGIKYILPVAVSAFKEFIHKKDDYFWITENLPRVITPEELEELIDMNLDEKKVFNLVKVN